MRFSFGRREEPQQRWVDAGALGWTPEEPFEAEPRPAPSNDLGWHIDNRAEPWADQPRLEPIAEEPPAAEPVPSPLAADPVTQEQDAPALLLPRLAIGAGQMAALYLLWEARAYNIWPGSPTLFPAFWLGGLVAPLLLLEGLGAVEIRRLLLWTGTIGFLLATLGLWLTHLPYPVPVCGLAIVAAILAHGWFRAAMAHERPLPARAVFAELSWTVAARLTACVAVWSLLVLPGLGKGWSAWPALAFPLLPLLGPVAAGVLAVTATGAIRRALSHSFQICFWLGLPLLLLGGLPLAGVYLLRGFFLQGH
jgi:hypothetical protein